jgi:hypothetical protein
MTNGHLSGRHEPSWHTNARLINFPRVGGPSARRIVDVAAICLRERERAIGLNAGDGQKRYRDRALGRIVLRRSDERSIDWHTRHRASMLNLHFDPCDDARQSTHGDGEAVSAQRAPDFEPIQQTLASIGTVWRW